MTRDRFLTELMGECWHEWNAETLICGKCCISMRFDKPINQLNFSTPEGFFKLWNWSKEQEWWVDFMSQYYPYELLVRSDIAPSIPQVLINPDTFADAVAKFRKWEGE